MRRSFITIAATSTLVAGLLGCDAATPEGDEPRTGFASVTCPDDVEALVLAEHDCGYVTTADGARLFVVRVQPPTASDRSPVVETGTDLGTAPDYAGLAPIAQRTDRPLIMVDLRGTGHSSPSLDCPEVDELAATVAARPAEAAADLTAAIVDCRTRLTAAGADPRSVDLTTTAEDLHAVVQAMGIDKAVASAHGTTGLAAIEWARRHPADLEAVVLDTPYFGDGQSDRRLDDLVRALSRGCRAAPACRVAHEDVDARWQAAVTDLADRPLVVDVGGTSVPIDGGSLRRATRWVLGGGAELGPGRLPLLVAEVADRRPGPLLQRYAERLVAGPPLCVGYLPKCGGERVAFGAALALYCPVVREEPAWREPCAAWGADPAATSTEDVVVPTLVLTGRFDPFSPTAGRVHRLLAEVVPGAFFVEDPAGPHNVLGGDCMRSIRTAWLNSDVRRPPPAPACLAERTPDFTN